MYRILQPERIVETAETLAARVEDRFPGRGLSRVAAELTEVARQARARCEEIRRPHRTLRALIAVLLLLAFVALALLAGNVKFTGAMWHAENFFSEVNDFLGSLVFFGAAILFLATLENRWKRGKALEAVGELRALAHIIDMHQLTKDPEPLLVRGSPTAHSPKRAMTPFELSRYFDYCSEMLSVTSKVGALYIQALPDPVALEAVDDLEELCTGLSRKIWQKIMILDRYGGGAPGDRPPA